MMMGRFFFLSITLMLCTSLTWAKTSIVSTVTEFDSAVKTAIAGDTIALKNGTWTNTILKFYTNGTKDNPVVLTAETAGEVILNGSSYLQIYGSYLEVHNLDFNGGALNDGHVIAFRKDSDELAENCRITNCRILDYNPDDDETDYKWVSIYGKNNRVDHCHFGGKNNEGALLVVWLNGEANNHQIDHNYFSDIPELGRNGGETIRIGTSTNSMTESRTIVEYNLFEACDGEIEIISNKSGFNIYRYNTFRDNDGGLTLRHGNDCEVYNNFFFGHSDKNSGGVRIIGERHKVYNNYFQDLKGTSTRAAISVMNGVVDSPLNRYFQVKNAEIVHNTIVLCKQPFAFGVGSNDELTLPPLNCIVANNVSDKSTGSDPVNYVDTPINMNYDSNYIFSDDLDIIDDGIINEDPELNLINGFWRPNNESVITDASTLLFDYVTKDMDGQIRVNTPEIGSDEVSSLEITNTPLTSADVGFNWDEKFLSFENKELVDINVFVKNNTLNISNVSQEYLPCSIDIYNILGQNVLTQNLNQSDVYIPVSNFDGIYIVKMTTKNQLYKTNKILF